VLAKPGTAVFFDRRIWHASSPNTSTMPRKVLFYGYSYRWLRPRDDMTVGHYLDRCGPIRRQLLGASASGGHGYSSPQADDVPLRVWLEEHLDPQTVPA
jgi:ectoine hydroxylase-related dioxygenase (phytanoyl-CoA dioxygenase family)